MAPAKVTRDSEPLIFKTLYGYTLKNPKVTLNRRDLVRISKAKKSFRRGYLPGFKKSTLHGGTHISDYPLELDGGITEIYVYSDIIESHFVGDTIAPLLRIIPVMSTKEDQIVLNYQRPLYFPLRKNYIDCIEIE
ncbi:uncharacterized protein TNCT_127081 [Trichonephila clavata]|uniref:Uncharacterized protein n=1 Tax=Trichonephila clavata TaxID=2740835 RepID=A0A8X6H106_TRICU|nr:uncharacterized protein TNCT_127081 [Trichonephila clavata]